MFRINKITVVGFAMSVLLAVPSVNADTIQLVNGDTVSGKVVSLDFNQVKLETELLGNLVIARDRVAVIAFGDRVIPGRASPMPAKAAPNSAPKTVIGQPKAVGVDAAVEQLKTQGIDPNFLSTLEKKFPLLANEEAQDYFNNTVGGLLSGKIGVSDVRKDAVRARDQLEDLREDFGDEFGPGIDTMLNAYLGILNKFIRETDPPPKSTQQK